MYFPLLDDAPINHTESALWIFFFRLWGVWAPGSQFHCWCWVGSWDHGPFGIIQSEFTRPLVF